MATPVGPIVSNPALTAQLDAMRIHLAKIEAIVGVASSWMASAESDVGMTSDGGAALVAMATALNTQLAAETSTTSTAGLNLRIRSTLGVLNKTAL